MSILSKLFNRENHDWHILVDKSEREGVDYYFCSATGDRKAVTETMQAAVGRATTVDMAFLQGGSGRYYIDGAEHGEPTNAEEAAKRVRAQIKAAKRRRKENQDLLLHTDKKEKKRSPVVQEFLDKHRRQQAAKAGSAAP